MRRKSLAFGRCDVVQTNPIVAKNDSFRQARVAVLAAKLAYQCKSDRWLPLLLKAVSAIEECPSFLQPKLMNDLRNVEKLQSKNFGQKNTA